MVLSLAACGSNSSAPAPAAETEQASAPAAAESEAPAAEAPASEAPAAEAPAAEASSEAAPAETASGEVDKSDWVQLTYSYATFLQETAPTGYGMQILQDKLNEEMGEGYITFEVFPSGTLLGGADILDGVLNGVADLGLLQPSYVTGRLPVTMVADCPGFYCGTGTAGTSAITEYLNTVQPEELNGLKVLFSVAAAPQAICSTEPIRSLEDMAGKQFRATSSTADAVTAFGAVPVSLDIGEVYEAMRNSLCDGCVSLFTAFGNFGFQEVAPYCTYVPFVSASNMIIMNEESYNKMPESQRAVFDECVQYTYDNFFHTYMDTLEGDPNSQQYCRDVELIFLNDEEIATFQDLVKDMPQKYADELDALGFDGHGLVELYQSLLDKYNAEYPLTPENYLKWRDE